MVQAGTKRWWALGAISLALVAAGLDATILNVALPTLATSLHASESQLQWFVAAYTLALAAAMLPAGLLGDRYGRRRVMMAALALFGAASAACALSTSPEAFIAARAVLGVAGAALTVMALSAIAVMFSEAERPRAVGIWAAANFLALPIGPLLGGWMLSHFWWGWVFLLNAPVSLVGLGAVIALVPESRSAERPGVDVVGVLSSSGGLTLLTFGVIQAGENGWSSASAIIPGLIGVVVLVAFGLWEHRLTGRPGGQPLIEMSLFRTRSFTWGVILAGFGVFGLFGALFALPQFFQALLGTDAQGSGVRLVPLIAGMVAGAIPADRIAGWLGPKLTVALGFSVLTTAVALGATSSSSSGDGFIAGWTFLVGLGAGIGLATASSAALAQLSADRSGVGSALMQAVTKLGPAFGASILGSVLNAGYHSHLVLIGMPAPLAAVAQKSVFAGIAVAHQVGSPAVLEAVRAAFVSGFDDALRLCAIVTGSGIVLALVFLPSRRRLTAPEAARSSVQRTVGA